MKSEEIVAQMEKYFPLFIGGSYKLVAEKLLKIEQVNDIDLFMKESATVAFDRVRQFLNDNNYTETKPLIRKEGYADSGGSLIFEKKGELTIHVNQVSKGQTTESVSIENIIMNKLERRSESDLEQIRSILSNMKPK